MHSLYRGIVEMVIIIRVWLFLQVGEAFGGPLQKIFPIIKYHSEPQIPIDLSQKVHTTIWYSF